MTEDQPFGVSGQNPPVNGNGSAGDGLPFGVSAPVSQPSYVATGDEPFGVSKSVDINSALPHVRRAKSFPMPVIPTRFDPEFGRWGHYQLPDIEGRKDRAFYPRVTTVGKALEDTMFLEKWGTAKIIEGLARHPEILDLVDVDAAASGDRTTLDVIEKLAEIAKEAAGGRDASEFGNAVHAWTEAVDLGVCTVDEVPIECRAHVAAYVNACRAEGIVALPQFVERIVYNPYTGAAGRIDRIAQMPDGALVVLDVKTTNNLNSGVLGIGVQLSQYATGTHILSEDGTHWEPMPPELNKEFAIVAHVPSKPDPQIGVLCDLVEIDLTRGIETMMLSTQVKDARSGKRHLIRGTRRRSLASDTVADPNPDPVVHAPSSATLRDQIWNYIQRANTAQDMSALFHRYTPVWTQEFTDWGMQRLRELGVDGS